MKDFFYGAIIAVLLGAFLWTYHKGETHIETADTQVVDATIKHDTKVEARAQTTVTQIAKTYGDVVGAPPAADAPHLWVRYAPSTCPSGANASTTGSADAGTDVPAAVPSAGGEAVDFGPPLDKLYQDADAQVTGLQGYIKACQKEGLCKRR